MYGSHCMCFFKNYPSHLYVILYHFVCISISENFTAFFDHLTEKVKLNEWVQVCGSMFGNGNTPSEWEFVIILFSCTNIIYKVGRSWFFSCLSSSLWFYSVLIHICSCLPWFIMTYHIVCHDGQGRIGRRVLVPHRPLYIHEYD